jgi:phosphoesterase RecJ-like protein
MSRSLWGVLSQQVRRMSNSELSEIIAAVHASERIVVVSHTNPDADAYGSSCGLAWGLRALGKKVVVHNDHGFIPRYRIIPGADAVVKGGWKAPGAGDLLMVVDCGAADRVGDELLPLLKAAGAVVNIDHHASNTMFGHLNFVVEGASSTSELVFELLKSIEGAEKRSDLIGIEAASCLLSGIIGDTGSFRYPSTTARTFRVAAELVERGARPDVLTQELFATQSLVALRLQSDALGSVAVHRNGFAEVVVTQEMLKRHGADILDADSLAERARDIEGVKVSALYKQDVDLWRISLRSRRGVVDVSEIAQSFGGGGHKAAAAFRWRNDLSSLQEQLRAAIAKVL